MTTPTVTTYATAPNGTRLSGFDLDEGVRVHCIPSTDEDNEHAFGIACELATSRSNATALAARITELETETERLRARVPPPSPTPLLGPGCVRERDGVLYLLNRSDRGWGEWGIRMLGWDDLLHRYDVSVSDPQMDGHGQYWIVSPRKPIMSSTRKRPTRCARAQLCR